MICDYVNFNLNSIITIAVTKLLYIYVYIGFLFSFIGSYIHGSVAFETRDKERFYLLSVECVSFFTI